MPYLPKDFPLFTKVPREVVNERLKKIESYFRHYRTQLKIDWDQISFSPSMLIEIIERVEKRRVYFHIYYDISMSQLNEAALYCFWIVKLCPFSHPDIPASVLNAKIALILFINVVFAYAKHTGKRINIAPNFIADFHYALMYRDITKESLMLQAASLII
jgi:hypothetical protein